jgi:histidinol-phosphatase
MPPPDALQRGLTDDLRLAHLLADDADSLTMSRFKALDLRVTAKPDLSPVTDADTAVEESIRRTLGKARPRDAVHGEEMADTGWGPRRWVVDPIDGTKNFVRGVPVWATLISLMVNDEVVVGVVSAPALGRRWWASLGGGAYAGKSLMSPTPCRVSEVAALEDASLSYAELSEWVEAGQGQGFVDLLRSCWRTRAYGDFWSYMLLAEGAVDIACEPEVSVWDLAALDVIVREAGGRFTSLAGRDGPYGGNALASNGMLHEVALGFLGAVDLDPEEPIEPAPGAPAGVAAPEGAVLDLASRRRPATWDPASADPDPTPGLPPLG